MSGRNPAAKLSSFIFAGLLCLAPSARTCVQMGLSEIPDSAQATLDFGASPMPLASVNAGLESFNGTYASFINSGAVGVALQVRLAIEFGMVQ